MYFLSLLHDSSVFTFLKLVARGLVIKKLACFPKYCMFHDVYTNLDPVINYVCSQIIS